MKNTFCSARDRSTLQCRYIAHHINIFFWHLGTWLGNAVFFGLLLCQASLLSLFVGPDHLDDLCERVDLLCGLSISVLGDVGRLEFCGTPQEGKQKAACVVLKVLK